MKPKRRSLRAGEASNYKLRRILQDIDEARGYGIQLYEISLNELYSFLKDARKQKAAFEREHPKGKFKYDPEEDGQNPYDNDGLADLETEVKKKRRRSKSKSRSKRK